MQDMSDVTERLVHIKQLYFRASQFAKQSDDVSLILVIQSLDFVVETFLRLVVSHFPTPQEFAPPGNSYYSKINKLQNEPTKGDVDFYRAWDEVIGRLRDSANAIPITDLPLRRDMSLLHKIRNSCQHEGSVPSAKDIQRYLPLVESFLTDTFQSIFGADFTTLSVLSLIQHPDIKEDLQAAYDALSNTNWNEAVCQASSAFHWLISAAQLWGFPQSVHVFLNEVERELLSRSGISNETKRLQEYVAIAAFGLDLGEYLTLWRNLPRVYYTLDGKRHFAIPRERNSDNHQWQEKNYEEDEARRIVGFVEQQALQGQINGVFEPQRFEE